MSAKVSKGAVKELVKGIEKSTRPIATVKGQFSNRILFYQANGSYSCGRTRLALNELGLGYQTQILNFRPKAENHTLDYINLRYIGMDENVATHKNSITSCPTLVDLETERVYVDSNDQMEFLSELTGGKLKPAAYANVIDNHSTLVMEISGNMPALMGTGDNRPPFLKNMFTIARQGGAEAKKKLACTLETTGWSQSAANLTRPATPLLSREEVLQKISVALDALEVDLGQSGGPLLCGTDVTKADIFYSNLFRILKWQGNADIWENGSRPKVQNYVDELFNRPAFNDSFISTEMRGIPSPHMVDMYAKHLGGMKTFFIKRQISILNVLTGFVAKIKGSK